MAKNGTRGTYDWSREPNLSASAYWQPCSLGDGFIAMNLLDVVRDVRRHLEENGRVSLRMLQRQFGLDEDALADIIEEFVDIQG